MIQILKCFPCGRNSSGEFPLTDLVGTAAPAGGSRKAHPPADLVSTARVVAEGD